MCTFAVCHATETSPAVGAAGVSRMYLAGLPVDATGIVRLLAFTLLSISSFSLESNLPGEVLSSLS